MKQDYITCVGGDESRAAFLIKGDENILYDAGMAYSAGKMIENIKRELKGEPLHAVLLSHSHYDHISGLPFLRKEWPDLKAYGSVRAKEIMEKPSARKVMRELSEAAAKGAGLSHAPEYDDEDLRVDVVAHEGDILTFGTRRVQVYETPGHTRCALSFLVDEDVIFASETVGVTLGDDYMPCYLVGYQMSLDSLKKLRACGAKRIFLTHVGILTRENTEGISGLKKYGEFSAEAVWSYLEDEIRRTKEEIVEIIERCPTEEERLDAMVKKYHKNVSEAEQPEAAFRINSAATLQVVERECLERKTDWRGKERRQ